MRIISELNFDPNQESGQSLLEVVIALAVALLVVIALVRLSVTSIRNATFAKNRALATRFAQEWIEETRQVRDEEGGEFFDAQSANDCDDIGNDPDGRGIFNRTRDCTLSGDSQTMTVTVVVFWSDAQGDHSLELTTSLTNWK